MKPLDDQNNDVHARTQKRQIMEIKSKIKGEDESEKVVEYQLKQRELQSGSGWPWEKREWQKYMGKFEGDDGSGKKVKKE